MDSPIIYGLVDSDTMELRWVGQTKRPAIRLDQHRRAYSLSNSNKNLVDWLHGTHFSMIVLECIPTPEQLNEAEIRWIKEMREQGARLINITRGGKGTHGHSRSPESRAKQSATMMGRFHTPEAREKMRGARLGTPMSPEQKISISLAMKGKPKSIEMRAARSASYYYNKKIQPTEWLNFYTKKLSELRKREELLNIIRTSILV